MDGSLSSTASFEKTASAATFFGVRVIFAASRFGRRDFLEFRKPVRAVRFDSRHVDLLRVGQDARPAGRERDGLVSAGLG
jgi:hypothetical protein